MTALFDASVNRYSQRPAIQYFCTNSGMWVTKNWHELSVSVARLANALVKHVKTDDRIALLSQTRPEWVIADIAIMKTACIVVPIYHSSLSDQIAYILADAGAHIILVENEQQLSKVRVLQENGTKLKLVVVFDAILGALKDNEIYLKDFLHEQADNFTTIAVDKSAILSLVYTSGTTGEPKGAMISHDNLLFEAEVIDKLGILSHEDVQLIFLPLAHIFARVLEAAWIRTGHLLAFAESVDKLIDNMAVIKPTFMAGVPRVYEKVRARVVETALANTGIKKYIAQWAFSILDKLNSKNPPSSLSLALAKKLVFDKIGQSLNQRFGGRLRFLVCGGAQLAPEVANFFHLCGIMLCEGYGLTETSAATCLNLPWSWRAHTVGQVLPGMEIKLGDDNEILVRGRGVFLGFWHKPEQTKEVLGADGWFHTGDIGEIDSEGFVKIIDRKKDIIITSQGKNISPQRVENLIKSKSPIIAHVVIIGERKPYLVALIALEPAQARAHVNEKVNASLTSLAANQVIYQEIKQAINSANNLLASFEQIKRFHILSEEFVIGTQLTPTLKVKRKSCAARYADEIAVLYS
jgi:long-chain acyl-CoA synthetase